MIDNSQTQNAESQSAISPEGALQILKEGNERFVTEGKLPRDLNQQIKETATGQYPFAAILSCIDSRVPPEIIFDQGIGDIFSVRVAGNIVTPAVIGSLEFACKVAGSKAILVLGHTRCGAVKGAYQNVEMGNLTNILSKIRKSSPDIDNASVEDLALANIRYSVYKLNESEILSEMTSNKEILIKGALYDVNTGKVEFL